MKQPSADRQGRPDHRLMVGALFLVAVVAIALVAWAVMENRSPAPPSGGTTGTAGLQASATLAPTAETSSATPSSAPPSPPVGSSQSPSPSMSIAPGVSPGPSRSPLPADARVARATVRRYELALVDGRYRGAWALLAPESRAAWGSLRAYASERGAFFGSAGSRFRIGAARHDPETLDRWMPPDFSGDATRAFAIRVDYPALAGNNAGWEIDIVAPGPSGGWLIWIAR